MTARQRIVRSLRLFMLIWIFYAPAQGQYERGDDVRTLRSVDMRFEEDVYRTAQAGEQLRVLHCNSERGLLYVAERDPERGLIALNLPLKAVEPDEETLKRRLDDLLTSLSGGRYSEALSRAKALRILDPLASRSSQLVVGVARAEEAARKWTAGRSRMRAAKEEAERLERNAQVVERPNALDAGPYNFRRSLRGYRYWNGYGYVYRYHPDDWRPPAQPAKDTPRKKEAEEMRARGQGQVQESQEALAAAEKSLEQARDAVIKLVEEYLLDVSGRALSTSAAGEPGSR